MITADTITNEQIRELRALVQTDGHPWDAQGYGPSDIAADCDIALGDLMFNDIGRVQSMREARARCAEILNARKGTTYPHTLTHEQFAIISVALDGSREREAEYVAKHADRPDDHLRALDELRRLWAFAGPIVINPRKAGA